MNIQNNVVLDVCLLSPLAIVYILMTMIIYKNIKKQDPVRTITAPTRLLKGKLKTLPKIFVKRCLLHI